MRALHIATHGNPS